MPQIITILPLTSIRISEIVDDGPLVIDEIRVAALVEKTPEEGISVQSPMSASRIDVDDLYENTDEHKTIIHDAVPALGFVTLSASANLKISSDAEVRDVGWVNPGDRGVLVKTIPLKGNNISGSIVTFAVETFSEASGGGGTTHYVDVRINDVVVLSLSSAATAYGAPLTGNITVDAADRLMIYSRSAQYTQMGLKNARVYYDETPGV